MIDTDKLVAAIFAAAMIAKQNEPTPGDFFGHYEACLAGLVERDAAEAVATIERTNEAHKKAWG
ncbi:MAG: hypothetical protein EXR07_04220 [Acetobacteraceae bacterium]|nr:hypothetical protein [Acetobacteraceae bacterium]